MILKSATMRSRAALIKRRSGALLTAGLVLLCTAFFGIRAEASESTEDDGEVIHNEVTIDIFSGETEAAGEEGPDASTAHIGEAQYYDAETGLFVFRAGSEENSGISSNACDGMYVNGAVRVIPDEGVTVKLYRNGYEDNDQNTENITLPGSYVLMVSAREDESKAFTFRIIDGYTNAVSYTIPNGFEINSAAVDGTPASRSSNYISFATEGEYEILYTCRASGVQYVLKCKVDHTAPELKLEAVDENGIARSAVSISDLEPGASIYATMDNKTYNVSKKRELTEPGYYTLTVMDEAGNSNVYSFTIRVYFTMSSILFFALLGLVLAGLFAYIMISRKKLKIR